MLPEWWRWLIVAGAVLLGNLGLTSAVAAQSSCGATYTVRRGDYLAKIARTCGVSYSDLLQANPWITNPSRIYAGQVLNIPSGESPLRIRFASGGTSATLTGRTRRGNCTLCRTAPEKVPNTPSRHRDLPWEPMIIREASYCWATPFRERPGRLADGLHPDARGHRVIADLLVERLAGIIGRREE